MNKQRRKVLQFVLDSLEKLRDTEEKDKALSILQDAQNNVELCADEEQDALDNRPESLQWSTVSTDMEDNISDLSDASGDLEVAVDTCQKEPEFCYQNVKEEVVSAVRTIYKVINR